MKVKTMDILVLTLVIVGAINWGLIGFFKFDLVTALFGNLTIISRILYGLIGISGLYAISYYSRK